jgi:RNA polymerase sigma-70 factor (ECF subfamily)
LVSLTRAAVLPQSGRLADDERAFEAVFRRQYARLHRVLWQLTGDPAEAEDLVQEVFLKLYRHRFPGRRAHDLDGWLYRTAVNTGLNALRGRRRRAAREDVAAAEGAAEAGDPLAAVAAREARGRVRAVLAELDERGARLLVLRHAGLSYKELADALGVAPGSVGTLLARAEARFEALYRARWGDPPEGGHA